MFQQEREGREGREFESFFHDSMISALRHLLGEGGLNAVLFNLDLGRTKDIKLVHEKLLSLFKVGTPVLERAILKELYTGLNLPYFEDTFEFQMDVQVAYSKFRDMKSAGGMR